MTSRRIHPLTGKAKNGHVRKDLAEALALVAPRRREVRATYDAARDSTEYQNYWANADHYDADSANSREVREKLVSRARYETANNGYADGMVQTYATDLVGVGPKLRMQTGSTGFNQLVEVEFYRWAKAVLLRRKLWCMAHAKVQDGEAFGVLRTNPRVNHPVKIDLVLYETEQCQTPFLPFTEKGYIDGIRFDEFGNPVYYDILRQHPGSSHGWSDWGYFGDAEQVEARYVLHWFALRRPGQHRGVPEFRSTLNTGASARRWREATLAAAETAADFSVFLKTQFQPDEMEVVSPMSTLDIQKRMMTALPMGWDAHQMAAEHPNATYDGFHKTLINEQARPKSMPYNKAACDSSSYNYASGRLDHQTYYGSLDVDREDGDDLVLDRLFDVWFEEAVRAYGWLGGNPAAISPAASAHLWDWPKHRVADVESEANANDKRLKHGGLSLSQLYSEQGEDFEDELAKMAADYGKTVDEMREVLLKTMFPSAGQAEQSQQPPQEQVAEQVAAILAALIDAAQPRDRRGRFASTGGAGGGGSREEVQKTRQQEDAAIRTRREQEDEQIEQARQKEDADIEKARDKEDDAIEKGRDAERAKVEREREKEDAAVEKRQEKEVSKLEDKQGKEYDALVSKQEKEQERLEKRRDKEDSATEARRDDEDEKIGIRRDDEDTRQQALNEAEYEAAPDDQKDAVYDRHNARIDEVDRQRGAEDQERDKQRQAEDRATKEQREQEDAEMMDRHDAEQTELEKKHADEAQQLQDRHEAENAERAEQREADDADRESRWEDEDRDRQERREEEDAERQERREEEDENLAGQREDEDDDLLERRLEEDENTSVEAAGKLATIQAYPGQPRTKGGRFGAGKKNKSPSAPKEPTPKSEIKRAREFRKKAEQGGLTPRQAAAYKGHATRAVNRATNLMRQSGMSDEQIDKALKSVTAKKAAKVAKRTGESGKKSTKKQAGKAKQAATKQKTKQKKAKAPTFTPGQPTTRNDLRQVADEATLARTSRTDALADAIKKSSTPVGPVQQHGMSKPEDMHMVEIDGVKFMYPPGKEKHVAETINSQIPPHGAMPEKLWQANERVVYTTQKNNKDSYWEKEYNTPGFTSAATGGDGGIVVYNDRSMGSQTFAHESGHNLATKTWGSTDPPKDSKYGKAQSLEPPVTEYGAKSPGEDFAEACKMYSSTLYRGHFSRARLESEFPNKYAAIQELIE